MLLFTFLAFISKFYVTTITIIVMFWRYTQQGSEPAASSELSNHSWQGLEDHYVVPKIKIWLATCKASVLLLVPSCGLNLKNWSSNWLY